MRDGLALCNGPDDYAYLHRPARLDGWHVSGRSVFCIGHFLLLLGRFTLGFTSFAPSISSIQTVSNSYLNCKRRAGRGVPQLYGRLPITTAAPQAR